MTKLCETASSNLSIAWAQAFFGSMQRGVRELAPLEVEVNDISEGSILEISRSGRSLISI